MKNYRTVLRGMAALLLVFGLAFVGCKDDSGDDGGGGSSSAYDGTYIDASGVFKLVLSGSSFTTSSQGSSAVGSGTFTVNGTTITLTTGGQTMTGTISSDGKTITLTGLPPYIKVE